MTYSHLTTAELTTIANLFTQGTKAYKVAQMLSLSVVLRRSTVSIAI